MVPTVKREPLRQIWHPEVIPGNPNAMAMPVWTRDDDEVEQLSRPRYRSLRGKRQDTGAKVESGIRRRNIEADVSIRRRQQRDSSGEESGEERAEGVDEEEDEETEGEEEDERGRGGGRRRTRTATSTTSSTSLPTAPPPAPTSIAPAPPPPPPPPPSESLPIPVGEPLPSSSTAANAEPTAIFRPLPEPSATATSSSSTSDRGVPMSTVTVVSPASTVREPLVVTTTIAPVSTKTEIHLPVLPSGVRPSGVRKGVDDGPDLTTTVLVPLESTPADKVEDGSGSRPSGNSKEDEGHSIAPTHAAMHALGAVGGVLVIAAFLAFTWWYLKKYRPKKRYSTNDSPPPPPPKPDNFRGLFSRKKANEQSTDREWAAGGSPRTVTTMDEKEMQIETTTYVNGHQRPPSVGSQFFAPAQLAVAIPPAHMDPNGNEFWTTWSEKDGRPAHMPNGSISTTAYFNNNLRPNPPYYKRTSEVSSLSSGFGDGDNLMLLSTANNTMDAAALTQLQPPPPATKSERYSIRTESTSRDTWYTEASEDQPARFRTINSWVRQQTGRIKREKQRRDDSDVPPVPALPAEEEYRMMMPDGEEPRRVDMNMDIGVAYGGTR